MPTLVLQDVGDYRHGCGARPTDRRDDKQESTPELLFRCNSLTRTPTTGRIFPRRRVAMTWPAGCWD